MLYDVNKAKQKVLKKAKHTRQENMIISHVRQTGNTTRDVIT